MNHKQIVRWWPHGLRLEQVSTTLLGRVLTSLMVACSLTASGWAAEGVLVIRAEKIYVGDGQVVDQGMVLLEQGRIKAVGADLEVPENATVIQIEHACVTPGLIDANARVESDDIVEPSRSATTLIPLVESAREHTALQPLDAVAEDATQEMLDDDPDSSLPLHIPEEGDEPEGQEQDAFSIGVRPGEFVNEQSSEVVPHTRVLDALNLDSVDFQRLARGGVTTVYVSPDPSAVIGARGCVVHTGGATAARVLVPEAAVKATIGAEPSRFGSNNETPSRNSLSMYARRPNSRMGLIWVFRKAFYDARRRAHGVEAYGSDTASVAATTVLSDVLEGKIPLRIQARLQRDISAALRLAEEFQLTFTLEEATEAYRCIDELKARQVPVVFGPIYETPGGLRAMTGEGRESRYFTFRALLDAGITTALSAQEFREEEGLARQVMYAMRFGVSLDDALRSVTLTPAAMLGLDGELGSVEVGKRADLVVWQGQPFAATSRIVAVLIDGQLVVDRR